MHRIVFPVYTSTLLFFCWELIFLWNCDGERDEQGALVSCFVSVLDLSSALTFCKPSYIFKIGMLKIGWKYMFFLFVSLIYGIIPHLTHAKR